MASRAFALSTVWLLLVFPIVVFSRASPCPSAGPAPFLASWLPQQPSSRPSAFPSLLLSPSKSP